MNQKLSDWASVAEVISGIAVVITLVFLIVGIRENSELTRTSMYGDHLGQLNQHSISIYTDPELARIWDAWIAADLSNLDATDIRRLEPMVATAFRTYEHAYLAYDSGLYGSDEWERMGRVACVNFDRAQANDFVELLDALMTRKFITFLQDGCPERFE